MKHITEGEETTDKALSRSSATPGHHIRNSMDHGRRPRRPHRGGQACGRARLAPRTTGQLRAIEVEDDARHRSGQMRELAVRKGIKPPRRPRPWTTASHRPDLRPGISSAEKITDISGRGVGMDVVLTKSRTSRARSTWSARCAQHQFPLALPLTLAIIDALLVVVNGPCTRFRSIRFRDPKIESSAYDRGQKRKAVPCAVEVLGIVELAETQEQPGMPTSGTSCRGHPSTTSAVGAHRGHAPGTPGIVISPWGRIKRVRHARHLRDHDHGRRSGCSSRPALDRHDDHRRVRGGK